MLLCNVRCHWLYPQISWHQGNWFHLCISENRKVIWLYFKWYCLTRWICIYIVIPAVIGWTIMLVTYHTMLPIKYEHGFAMVFIIVVIFMNWHFLILVASVQPDTLLWRHNERDGVSITGVPIVCSNVCSGADQRKHQSSASLAFVSPVIGEFPTQQASIAEMSIWWRHHEHGQLQQSILYGTVNELIHKSHNTHVPYSKIHIPKYTTQNRNVHFCSEWCIVGYVTGVM